MDRMWRFPQLACQISRLKPSGLLFMGMDERTGLQCEGGNARCIAFSHFGCRRRHQRFSGSCNEQLAQFTTDRHSFLRPGVAFSKTNFKHRSIQINGNFTKLTLLLYFKCIMYYAGLLLFSFYCQ